MAQRPLMTSLVKATQVLDLLMDQGVAGQGLSLSEIARQMQLPLNSVHSILRTLCTCEYTRLVKRGAYGLGPKLLRMASHRQIDEAVLRPRIIQLLKQCAVEQGEAYVCSVLRHGERHIFASVECGQAVKIDQTVLDDAPFYSKVSCRILTAFCSEYERQEIISRQTMPGSEWPEVSTDEDFENQLELIRNQGYLVMHDSEWDVLTIACPLLTQHGTCWGTLGSFAPHFRMGQKRQDQWVEHLRAIARETIIEMPT